MLVNRIARTIDAARRIARIGLLPLVLLASAAALVGAQSVGASSHPSDPGFSRPRLAPGAGTLVFFSYRELRGSYYAESAAGGPLRLLFTGTNDPGDLHGHLDDDGVVWAPDGKHFLYLVLAPPGQTDDQLWLSDLTGHDKRLVARDAWPVSWSPDGRKIAFAAEGLGAIWVVDASGRNRYRLTKGHYEDDPVWSPDGRLIADLDPGPRSSPCGFELLTVAAGGGAPRVLARRVVHAPPSWSPNGKRIAFEGFTACASRGTQSYPTGLYVADRWGRHLHLIDRAANGAPAWSPDGKWIAVARGGDGSLAAENGTWIEHPDGSAKRRLTGMVPWTVDVDRPIAPVWAPDSRAIAGVFSDQGEPPVTDVWVLGLSGAVRQITQGFRYGYHSYGVSWQPRNLPQQRLGGTVVSPAIPTDSLVVNDVLETTRPVRGIVADGARVAIHYEAGSLPGGVLRRVETWDTASGSVIRFESGGNQGGIALAGDRVVQWAADIGIWVATSEVPRGRYLQGVCPQPGVCEDAPAIGDVIGKGSLLVFDSWKRLQATCGDTCHGPKQDGRLFRIDDGTAVQIAASSGELTPLAVDNGRILADEGSGTLAILDSNGAEHLKIAVPGFTEATLQGRDLVVHTGETLADYDATSGVLVHAWHVPADAKLQDAEDGVALYVTSTDVHLLRLVDGHETIIAPSGSGPLHVQLEPAGLFYSYTVSDPERPGRVAFVPAASLP